MPKFDMETIANLQNESSVVATINVNFQLIEEALDEVLFRTGDGAASDNAMVTDLDMNSRRILNLPAPEDDLEPARHGDIQTYVDAASASADAAAASETAADESAQAAAASETAAGISETNAAASESGSQDILDEMNTLGVNSGAYTPVSLGTPTGTITPEPVDGSLQTATNNGVFTVSAPTTTGWYRLVWKNGASAGIVSLTNFNVIFDEAEALENVAEDTIVELNVVNDGVAKVAQVVLLIDGTPA